MINQVYQLVSPRQIEVAYKNKDINDESIIVRPLYLSICAADQRYYTGNREEKTLEKKLPMSLIHEGVGEIVYDSKNEYRVGTKVVMIPNTPFEKDEVISENYLPSSKFRSSGYDGFMQDYVFMGRDRVVPLPSDIELSNIAFTELVTVGWHSIQRFIKRSNEKKEFLGIWGDGNLGFITAILLKHLFPESKIYVFGKTNFKLSHFSFVDEVFYVNNIPKDLVVNHTFECVGGRGSESAINQMIDIISPEGSISLLGVSEYPVQINTRMVLEKGITLIGSSRSGLKDFQEVVELYKEYPDIVDKLALLKGNELEIKTISDATNAFEADLASSWGKSILKWTM